MQMLKIIEGRKSIRAYKDKPLSAEHTNAVLEIMNGAPKNMGDAISFQLVNADANFDFSKIEGYVGYHGNVIKAPHYVVVLGENNTDSVKIGGYLGEWLILQLTRMDIATCWMDIGDNGRVVSEAFELETEKMPLALIACGYSDDDRKLSNIYENPAAGSLSALTKLGYPNIDVSFNNEPVSGRKSIIDIVFNKQWDQTLSLEELQQLGLDEVLFYMRLAPSWGNRQPWHFILKGEQIILVLDKSDSIADHAQLLDAGIAMLYFEVAMHSHGMPGKWNLDIENVDESTLKIPAGHVVAGYYSY